jgi:hypothetical protein
MEIFPNVYEIKSVFGNRWVQQYLFVGDIVVLLCRIYKRCGTS